MKLVLNMRFKIFLTALIANLLVIIIISSLFYQKSADFFNEQYAPALAERLYIGTKNADKAFQEVYRNCLDMAFNERIRQLTLNFNDKFNDNTAAGQTTDADLQDNLQELHTILNTYAQQHDLVDNIYCYLPQSHTLIKAKEFNSIQTVAPNTALAWEHTLSLQQGIVPLAAQDVFTTSGKNIYLYKAAITDAAGSPIAYIISTISERALYYKYLDDIVRDGDSYIYMFDTNGTVVSANHPLADTHNLFQTISHDIAGYTDVQIDNKNYLGVYNTAPFSQYAFCLAVNKNSFLDKLIMLQILIISCAVIILTVSSVALYFMTLRLNKPIEELAKAMKHVSRGNLNIQAKVYSKDEIGYLSVTFNYMISRIRKLVDAVANEKAKKKEAELNALQYQIRPHFIYNTLNTIRFAALMQGAKNISALLGNFIELLQVSTNRKGSFAPLNEELTTLKSYIALQDFRMPDTFKVNFAIDDKTLNYYVPRLILQPLVENSILHGLSEAKPFCTITIHSYTKNAYLYLEVTDDGKGMSSEQMAKFSEMTPKTSGGFSSIGVFNIMERLQLYYGEKGFLHYISDHQSYTTAQIRLPISTDINEYNL